MGLRVRVIGMVIGCLGDSVMVARVAKDELLSFRETGRILEPCAIESEFEHMRKACGGPPVTLERLTAVCRSIGTHNLKIVSADMPVAGATLRVATGEDGRRAAMLPACGAQDIRVAKLLLRPLEVEGFQARSMVEHVVRPDDLSNRIYEAFGAVFGAEALVAVREALCGAAEPVRKLNAGQFPVVFVPRPGGDDLQVTPVFPAECYMEMQALEREFYWEPGADGKRPFRGAWVRQVVSAKMRNVSGAMSGSQVRFLAEMPPGMRQEEAEIWRFVHGGRFPRWRERDVSGSVLRYADRLEADRRFNNANTRRALDEAADRLIERASDFASEIVEDAGRLAQELSVSVDFGSRTPTIASILLARGWGSDLARARRALTGSHFSYREQRWRLQRRM